MCVLCVCVQVVHSSLEAMVSRGVRPSDPELVRPEEEEVEKVTEETRLALEKLTNKKISAAMPVRAADKQAPAQYIRCAHVTVLEVYIYSAGNKAFSRMEYFRNACTMHTLL